MGKDRSSNRTIVEVQEQELRSIGETLNHNDVAGLNVLSEQGQSIDQNLLPADGGLDAWKMLLAGWAFEGIIWGFCLSFGVFQNYYSQLPEFKNNKYISIIGTIATAIPYLGSPVMLPLMQRNLKRRSHLIWAGWILCILGLLVGSFANTFATLIITQGVMYGTGYLLILYPTLSYMNEWWIQRRGMAFGLLCSSTGISGLVLPFLAEELLHRWGYKTTLRAMAIGVALLTAPLLPLLKARLPNTDHAQTTRVDWSFLRRPQFYVFSISNVAQGLGYFFPALYLPSHATSIGLSPLQGALLLAAMSITQVLGQFAFGWATDKKYPLTFLIVLSTSMSALASLALWGLARSMAMLSLFAIFWGFFGNGFVSLWTKMITTISDEPSAALSIFGLFCFGKGVGNVLAGPISAGLLQTAVTSTAYGAIRYRGLVIFTGIMMSASAAVVGLWHLGQKARPGSRNIS